MRHLTRLSLLLSLLMSPSVWADYQQGRTAYEQGDYKAAHEAFAALAREGDARGYYRLGEIYRLGKGTEVDMEEAFRMYKAASVRGHSLAQNALGVLYATGSGTEPNDLEAFAWFTVAALQGNEEARKNAERASNMLSKARLASGQLMARQYFENYVGRLKR